MKKTLCLSFLALFSACGTITKHNLVISVEGHPDSLTDASYVDAITTELVDKLDMKGLLTEEETKTLLFRGNLYLVFNKTPFYCPGRKSVLVNGCRVDHHVYARMLNCKDKQSNVLAHELVHFLLHKHKQNQIVMSGNYTGNPYFVGDGDPDHEETEWWDVVENVQSKVWHNFCSN